jgi:hypothetical protein
MAVSLRLKPSSIMEIPVISEFMKKLEGAIQVASEYYR